MAKAGFSLDFKRAMENLMAVDHSILAAAEKGVGRALLQVKTDMIMQRPTAPIKEGFLRGATSIHVQEEELNVPLGPREKADKKVQGYKVPVKKGKIIGIIGINVPYAARWHEVPAHFSDPEAGNKYLESKMANNKMTYKKIIQNTIAEEAVK